MAQYEMSLRDYQRIVLKRKRTIFVCVVLVGIATLVFTRPPKVQFEAVSKIRVARAAKPTGLYNEILMINEADDIATHQVSIIGQQTLIAVAHKLKQLPENYLNMDIEKVVEECFNYEGVAGVVKDLGDRIKVQREGTTNILAIKTRALSAAAAQRLADTVAKEYAASTNKRNNVELDNVVDFVEKRYAEAQARVTHQQGLLQDKRASHLGKAVASKGFGSLVAEKTGLEDKLKAVRAQIQQLKQAREDKEGAVIDFVGSGVSQSRTIDHLNTRLVSLQLDRQQLLVYHTATSPKVRDIDTRIAGLINGIVRELEEIESSGVARIATVDQTLRESPQVEMELTRLEGDLTAAQSALEKLANAKQDLEIKRQERVITVRVVERASGAKKVKKPGKFLKVVVGCIVGMILGFLWAIVLEVLDTSIDTIEDVEEFLDTPVMGVIPHIDVDEIKAMIRESNPDLADDKLIEGPVLLTTQLGPKSSSAEAFRTLRTNLEFAMTQRNGNALAIASASLGEGKTSTSCNLAVALAQNGKRTILVDGDLRRPAVFKTFGLEKQPGLSEVLQGRLAVKEAVRTISDVFLGHMSTEDVLRTPGLENLHILTCGGIPSNPSELLSQERTRQVIQELKDSYDVVLVDGPPLLPVADSVILGALMDGVVLVYQVGKVGRGVLKRSKVQLDNVGAKVWGIVLNDLTPDLSEFKDESQYYRHYYYKEEPASRGGWLSRTFGRSPSTG